jgi:excisionase family DNA binding protein
MPHDLIASQDVCELLNIDRSTLSRWVKAGRITPAMRMPGQTGAFLFSRDDVDELVAMRAGAA